MLARIQTKRGQLEAAEPAGVPVPRTAYPASVEEARAAGEELGYPVLVKPSSTEGFKRRFGRQAFRCETAAEVARAFADAEPYEPMVQELIPGGDERALHARQLPRRRRRGARALLRPQAAPDASGCGHLPRGRGASGSRRSSSRGSNSFVRWSIHGLSQVEFKRDRRDGSFKLMEVNPRLWQWHGLAAACGVDLPLIAYRDLTGERREPVSMNGRRRRWAITLLPGEAPAPQRPPYVDAVFARDDLKPALVQVARLLKPMSAAAGLGLRSAPAARMALGAALLALSRLLPAHGLGLGLRLAAATACLLLPGALVARALGLGGLAPAFAWSMGALFCATAVMFAVHSSLWLALALLVVVAVVAAALCGCAAPAGWRPGASACSRSASSPESRSGGSRGYDGDAFFHLAREQKLLGFDSLSLRSVDEFRDGGLHPGYAFPLWHAAVAIVARLAGVGPASVVLHAADRAAAALVPAHLRGRPRALPLALGRRRDGGRAIRAPRARPRARRRVHLARAPGDCLAGAAAAGAAGTGLRLRPRPLLAPRRLDRGRLDGDVARPPEPLGARRRWARRLPARAGDPRRSPRRPAHRRRPGRDPRAGGAGRPLAAPGRARDRLSQPVARGGAAAPSPTTGSELDVFGLHSYRLAPELFGRAGAIAVASLVLLPLARLRATGGCGAPSCSARCWSTFAVTLLPFVFPHFADAVSISQARRIVGFAPRDFVLVGGALVLAGFLRWAVLPVALAAGIALQHWPSRATSGCPTGPCRARRGG